MPAHVVNNAKGLTQDGVETKPLFIKQISMGDWENINKIRLALGGKSVADAIRFAVRKAAGQ